jgi:AsmA protein
MNKTLKILLLALAALLALVLAGLAYVAATFDPNAHKPRLVELVREHTGRTLAIPGDIRLTLWPRIGVQLGALTLSEAHSEQTFAAVQNLQVGFALWPLLSRQLVVDHIRLDGLQLRIARDRQGRTNFADLLPAASATTAGARAQTAGAALALDIGGIQIHDARIDYVDAASGRKLSLNDIRLTSGPVADGRSSDLELAAHLQGQAPALQLRLMLGARFTPLLAQRALKLQDLQLRIEGAAAGIEPLQIQLTAPAVDISADRAQAAALTLQLQAASGAARYDARLSGALVADWTARRYTFDGLQLLAHAPQPGGALLQLQGRGQLSADWAQDRAQLSLNGQFDQTTLALKLALENLSRPAVDFDLELGELDADHYLRSNSTQPIQREPAGSPAAGPDPVIDLGPLQGLNLRGNLKVRALKFMNLKAQALRLQLKARDGRAEINPLAVSLYGGTLQGTLGASAGQPQRFTARLDLREVQLGPLLQDLMDQQPLDGRGQLNLDLRTSGNTLSQFKRGLDGSASLRLRDGAIRGINLAALLRDARARLGGEAASGRAAAEEKTDFSELSASFKVSEGVARNDDLAGKSPLLRLGGQGTVWLAEDRLDYTFKATVVPTLQGQGGPELQQLRGLTIPVRISGPYRNLGWQLDWGALAQGRASEQLQQRKNELQQQTQRKLEEEKAKLQQQAEDRLKQLLGR